MIPLSQSLARSYLSCPRQAYYGYSLRRRAVTDDSRLDGIVAHEALASYYGAIREGHNSATATARAVKTVERSTLGRYRQIELTGLMIGYGARYGSDSLTVLDVERSFKVAVGGEVWQGRIDLIAADSKGRPWVWEHKTTEEDSSPGSKFWQRLDISYQDPLYIKAAQEMGYDVAGVIYNVLARGVVRPQRATPVESRKFTAKGALYATQRAEDESSDAYLSRLAIDIGTRPQRYFTRQALTRSSIWKSEAERDLIDVGRLIRASEQTEAWPRNPASCQRFGRACDYLPVCTGQGSIEDYPEKQREENHG